MNTDAPPEEKLVAVDFPPTHDNRGICVPKGCRVLIILGEVAAVPGPHGCTRLYVHPEDVATIKARNYI